MTRSRNEKPRPPKRAGHLLGPAQPGQLPLPASNLGQVRRLVGGPPVQRAKAVQAGEGGAHGVLVGVLPAFSSCSAACLPVQDWMALHCFSLSVGR